MKANDKIQEFRSMIESALLPEIDNNYIICGLPNYSNIGDMLIFQGILDLLKKSKYKCLDYCFYNDYHFSDIKEDVIFLIKGGGYFGDVWRKEWNTVVQLVNNYPNNKFIILPQSIYYSDSNIAKLDANILSKNKNVLICARDQESYITAKSFFTNRVLLIPDLAFFMDRKWYSPEPVNYSSVPLFIKRNDRESVCYEIDSLDMDICDWPTMDIRYRSIQQKICEKSFSYYRKVTQKYSFMRRLLKPIIYKFVFSGFYRPLMIRKGVQFINGYQTIYTSRLHGMILSIMMDKSVFFIDNSYGKILSYYKTWLSDINNLKPLESKN